MDCLKNRTIDGDVRAVRRVAGLADGKVCINLTADRTDLSLKLTSEDADTLRRELASVLEHSSGHR